MFNYVLNDPTTPDLVIPVELQIAPNILSFTIDGFSNDIGAMYTLEHQAAMCHYGLIQAINLMNKTLRTPIINWSSTTNLIVQPRAGRQFNAYYDRKALRFFFANDPVNRNTVYAVNSSDVRQHETGHALLDAIRPDLFNLQAFEVWAFHEAFGDIHAIINLLQSDFAIDYILKETNNNLNQSCILSKLAEEMGTAIYDVTGGRGGHTSGVLRNAYNGFTYIEPEKLPRNTSDDQLSSEPHNFSRVFLGAWYDILVAIYNFEKSNLPPKEALIKTRDILTFYTFNAISNAPATIRFYDSFAKAILVQDKINNYAYNQLINDVFIKRNILKQAVRPMISMRWNEFKPMLEPMDEVVETPQVAVVRTKNIETLTLPDLMLNIEVPNDTYYEFDSNGDCVDSVTFSSSEVIEHARNCVDFLKEKGMIRPDQQTPFEIDANGNLVRSHFACMIGNCTNFGQPEYNKCWKSQNNAGCGCGGKNKKPTCNNKSSKVIMANIRLQSSNCGFSNITSSQNVNLNLNNNSKIKTVC